MVNDPTNAAKQQIEELEAPSMEQLPFSYVEKPSNKTTRLLANSLNPGPIEGQHRWYEYSFKEPVFIQAVVINHSNYSDYSDFSVEVIDSQGNPKRITVKSTSNKTAIQVNQFTNSFKFKPPKDYFFSKKTINSVYIFGFDQSKAGEFINYTRRLGEIADGAIAAIENRESVHAKKIAEAELAVTKVAEATKELQSLKGQSQRQRSSIQNLEVARNDLNSKIEAMRESFARDEREQEILRISIANKNSERAKLDSDVSKLTTTLAELRANVDLFPTELSSFVTQGRQNTKTLFTLASIPILTLFLMFLLLISGAVDLTTKIDPEGRVNIAALIASRAPYVAVALAIITACYKIAKYFMLEIIEINRQRLNLTKIGIIAKDISSAAEVGLDLSDVERYGLRVRLKMELLKDHLKGYISSNLDVQLPSSVTEYQPFSGILKGTGLTKGKVSQEGEIAQMPPEDDASK